MVDNKASCVFVFQPNGKLVQRFGTRGSEPGKFAGPHFVAINSQDHIIISDFHNHSIKVSCILNGAHLASATVPWHWLFFCPAPKIRVKFGCPVTKSLKAPKWHWLILAPMGALGD